MLKGMHNPAEPNLLVITAASKKQLLFFDLVRFQTRIFFIQRLPGFLSGFHLSDRPGLDFLESLGVQFLIACPAIVFYGFFGSGIGYDGPADRTARNEGRPALVGTNAAERYIGILG